MYLTVKELLQYTDEERARWDHWFQANGDELLGMPIAGERETTIGRLIMHIFGPELRYIERLRNEPLTDYRSLPASTVEAVFGFGLKARQTMRDYVAGLAADDWTRVVEFDVPNLRVRASVRKIILHCLTHEIRHWAQVARLIRERGFVPPGGHDLLTSGALE
jgi:uncharacterized damage-inducible protein DinB